MFISRDHVSNSQTMDKFTLLLGVKGTVFPCFKQLPSNLSLNLDLFHCSSGEKPLFAV